MIRKQVLNERSRHTRTTCWRSGLSLIFADVEVCGYSCMYARQKSKENTRAREIRCKKKRREAPEKSQFGLVWPPPGYMRWIKSRPV